MNAQITGEIPHIGRAAISPEFTRDDYGELEAAVLALVPTNPEQLADADLYHVRRRGRATGDRRA